ncbi:ATP-binding protein [Glaciecola sp. 1036]|uniref:sensor histidine kinase n=1 Tax=Alteromonadaceae TaxID=72275 RepID=UPI003D083F57
MYKNKLYAFGVISVAILMIALICTAVAAQITRTNLQQSTTAQTLLSEHQQLSSISYRLFKQLTDELIFGQNANQAEVRNKRQLITISLAKIRQLEISQREALGEAETQGTVEDTDELESLIDEIITEFKAIIALNDSTPLRQQERLQRLLEVTIDNQFREAINSAVSRQSRVVSATNARIDTLNTTIMWFAVMIGLIAAPSILVGCYWLFSQLYQPLSIIQSGTETIATGNYQYRLPESMDKEFQTIVQALNKLAIQLAEHENMQAESRKQLEFEVERRTQELRQANLQLTQIDSKRRQFIADVSHEFRTPLTIIRGEAQVTLRQKQGKESEYRDSLKVILNQAIGLSRLVEDLLLLARAEIDQMSLQLNLENMKDLVENNHTQWQRQHPERRIDYFCEQALDDLYIKCDAQKISQALSILMDNAIKYSKQDSPIEVRLRVHSTHCHIEVRDHGDGIAPAELEHIFERFVRFKHRSEGFGLGLSIAKVIMHAHNGDVIATSTANEGSTFTLQLPLGENK